MLEILWKSEAVDAGEVAKWQRKVAVRGLPGVRLGAW